MVKSRTFGQKLPAAASAAPAHEESAAAAAAATVAATAAAAAAQELEQDDDSGVFLLMAPYIDMINHAQDNNCVFGIDDGGQRWVTATAAVVCMLLLGPLSPQRDHPLFSEYPIQAVAQPSPSQPAPCRLSRRLFGPGMMPLSCKITRAAVHCICCPIWLIGLCARHYFPDLVL
jgi:hypothetical protein